MNFMYILIPSLVILFSTNIYLLVAARNNKLTRTTLNFFYISRIFLLIGIFICIAMILINSNISKSDINNIRDWINWLDSLYFDAIILLGYIILQAVLIILKKKSFNWKSQKHAIIWLIILPLTLNQISKLV